METLLITTALVTIVMCATYCGYHLLHRQLTTPEKMMLAKALKFYEDVALHIADVTKCPEQLADDMRTIDKIKEKIK